ncbi:PREDICTED: uncharacterized protein LOC104799416 [Tarenaya hassleriana]|uniref:uncharacterized protein LOC104799416 n=1 Tax=Tarenaya hassleriana TaxID=28532 RepID=UPI00053C73C9|nr:PREDICTED: uncharacterized protein LOC104799416 [Tarenaya hassleriana]XP_019056333.1 PREDICTED: uncharacterized protein LOC104799416 [Tarenaya hassleriana]
MECQLKPPEAPKEQPIYKTSSSSKPLQNPAEQCMKKRASGERELVKYMSKLPGFLERTETPQDKFLNVGVLDWGRLEKWQHSHTHTSGKSSHPSVSELHASVALSKDESSIRSRKVQTHSSVHQRTQHNAMQFHLFSTPETGSQIPKSYNECVKECRNRKTVRQTNSKDHRYSGIPNEQVCQGIAVAGSDRCESKNLIDNKICPKCETLSNGLKPEFGLNVEIKSKTHKNRRGKHEETLNESNQNDHEGEVARKPQGASELYHLTKKVARKEAKPSSRRSSTKGANEFCDAEVDNSKKNSCSLPVPLSEKASASSSQDKRPALLPMKDSAGEHAQGQGPKLCDATSDNGRNISPFQRLGSNTSKTCKQNGERYAVPVTQLNSKVNSAMSGSQNVATSSGIDNSDSNRPGGKDRAAISPFRRLLEPLLRPKATHSGNSSEDPRAQRFQRVKLGIGGCKTVNIDDSAQEKRVVSTMVQAVLRAMVKNNQLLFTFAVNKESDILAATVKKLGSLEGNDGTTIHNFFSIQEHKKNGAWLNQRGKGQTHGIISNVFAQMRVSSSPAGAIKEFVLFSVDLGQGNGEKSHLQLKNELAAIVIKMPRRINTSDSRDTVQNRDDGEENCLEDRIEGKKDSPVISNQDISVTVILQSGVHSLPHKGGPSSLIQRWRSGGSCDCGGWDIGCNLRVLSNRSSKNPASSSSERLDLFSLGGQPEEQPFLSFIPFKEGIYSVGYNSSLSQLQAFSICIAVAESRKLSETLEQKSSHDEHNKASVRVPDQETKCNGTAEDEVAERYVAYPPPLSPAGRV